MDVSKEIDSRPLTQAFSFERERERALHGLKGILAGVVADKRLNEKEFLFLDAWLKSQQYLTEDKNFLEILSKVGEILEDGLISPEELEQIESRIQEIVSENVSDTPPGVSHVDELIGFLTGVASDGMLNDEEVGALNEWLTRNESIKDRWPASAILDRLSHILEDGIITDEERKDLLVTVNQVTGTDLEVGEVCYEVSTEVWEDKTRSTHWQLPGPLFVCLGNLSVVIAKQ